MTEALQNPFRPGAGLPPAYMGHRPEVEGVLFRFLQTLRSGRLGAELGFLYGPRGNGKTVLLHWLHAEAEKDGAPDEKIALVRLSPDEMDSPASLAQRILNATFGSQGEWTVGGGLNLGAASVQVTRRGKSRVLSLAEILSEETGPLLLTLDEAHEVRPAMLGALLNAVQRAGEVRPVAAVFAGTPGLEAKLLEARSSFWGRGEKLRIGLLSETSAREALARPFRDAGLETDDEAVAKLTAAADNYPYFLQLYGRTAWDMVKESGSGVLLPEHVAPTVAAADGARRDYYNDRYEEFYEAKFLPLARRVAEAFVASADAPADRSLSDAALEDILADQDDAGKARKFLAAKGYVWRDRQGDRSWTPGIPSLMDYMIKEIPAPEAVAQGEASLQPPEASFGLRVERRLGEDSFVTTAEAS